MYNPLDVIRSLVDQATSEILNTVDWGANMSLVDEVNSTDSKEVLTETVRHIRKRIQSKSPNVVMTSLSLIETLVKNCHTAFHTQVATEKFMESMSRVARSFSAKPGRDSSEVVDKCLELIQSWGEDSVSLPLYKSCRTLFARTFEECDESSKCANVSIQ